jgi:hypothetical protein
VAESSVADVCLLDEPPGVVTLASPKSRTLAWPRLVTKMLAGLMSQQVCHLQGLPANALLQRHAIEELHDHEDAAILLADVVKGADVGMVERRGGTSLAAKAFQRLRVAGNIVGKELKGDEAAQAGVFGLVYYTHATAADFLDDAVVRDHLVDHQDS